MLSSVPTSSTTSSSSSSSTSALLAPLRPRPDQRESWLSLTKPIPFDAAASRVLDAHTTDGARTDLVTTDLRGWAFGSSNGSTMELAMVPYAGRDLRAPLALRELAMTQLCTKLGAPAPYLRDLPAKLQVACMNFGLASERRPATLRLAGNEVRAIVSERYAPIDDALLLELVDDTLRALGRRHDALVRSVATGPHTLVRITLPSEGIAVKRGDVIEHGLDIGNSELGIRSVQVTPVTWRLACENGLRSWSSSATTRLRHIGDPARLREALRDAIPLAFAEARGDLDRWRRAVNVTVDDALAEIEALRGFGFSLPELDAAKRELVSDASSPIERITESLRGRSTSAFDVINAATAVARTRVSVDRRLELEQAAHRSFARLVG